MGFLKRIGRIFLWLAALVAGLAAVAAVAAFFLLRGLIEPPSDRFGTIEDEAMRAGMSVADFPGAG